MSSSTRSFCHAFTKNYKPCKRHCKNNAYCHNHKTLYKYNRPDNCLICYENLNEVRPLKCGHWIHKKCVEKWSDINKKNVVYCPICNSNLTKEFGTSLLKRIKQNIKINKITSFSSISLSKESVDDAEYDFISNVLTGMFR